MSGLTGRRPHLGKHLFAVQIEAANTKMDPRLLTRTYTPTALPNRRSISDQNLRSASKHTRNVHYLEPCCSPLTTQCHFRFWPVLVSSANAGRPRVRCMRLATGNPRSQLLRSGNDLVDQRLPESRIEVLLSRSRRQRRILRLSLTIEPWQSWLR